MFHVFYVNNGCMLVPQTSGLGGRVLDLQQSIRDLSHVDVADQVLYLSNGEQVHGSAALSNYAHVGTETAPFFLLRRNTQFNSEKYLLVMPESDDVESRHQIWQQHLAAVERNLNVSVNEFIRLWQYGQQLDEKMYRMSCKLVEDHKYLYQGWQAMMKNLTESTARMQRLLERGARNAERLTAMRERGISDLTDFDDVLKTLAKIMVPTQLLGPALIPGSSAFPTSSSSTSSNDEISLYDWLASTDTMYSPSEMVAYLADDLQHTDDTDLRAAQQHIAFVNAILGEDRHRDIGGVDRRITAISDKLLRIEEKHYLATELADRMLKEVATTSISYHRRRLPDFKRLIKECYAQSINIVISKEELTQNIITRVSNWIQRCYEKLAATRKCLLIFEEKFNGLRDRLRLVRQIREAPILYVTAVAEVIRRDSLQKEFNTWITTFMERCTKFINDENKVRREFYSKLGEHFLRNIFFDLSDQMPDFRPHCVLFDRALPHVSISHLRELRKTFPEMQEFLKVTRPRVYERLAVTDLDATPQPQLQPSALFSFSANDSAQSNAPSSEPIANNASDSTGEAALRREESFFVREPTTNIDTINQNFPSQNWLSEEHIDMSPASQLFIATRSTGLIGSNSNASLHVDTTSLASPAELGPLSDFALSAYDSRATTSSDLAPLSPSSSRRDGNDPVLIPGNSAITENAAFIVDSDENGNGTQTVVMDVSTSTVRQPLFSTCSSPFGTPDSDFEPAGSLKVARPTTLLQATSDVAVGAAAAAAVAAIEHMSTSLEICSPSEIGEMIRTKCAEANAAVSKISQLYAELRESIAVLQTEMKACQQSDAVAICALIADRDAKAAQHQLKAEESAKAEYANLERQKNELNNIVEHERYLRKEKERELDEQRRVAEKLNEDMLALIKAKDNLHAELLKSEQERQRIREQLDAEVSMDYLQIELKTVEQLLKRELTSDEVNEIMREIEKRKISKSEVSSLNSDSAPSSLSTVGGGMSSPQQLGVVSPSDLTSKKRSEYEKAFRSKMELIVRGVEEKKNKEMAVQREEIEAEIRKESDAFSRRLKERIIELEERVIFFEHIDDERRKRDSTKHTTDVELQVCLDANDDGIKPSKDGSMVTSNVTSDEQSISVEADVSEMSESTATVVNHDTSTAGECLACTSTVAMPSLVSDSRSTQTRIRGHDMNMMISLRNIQVGCSVLVMWNMAHNAYMIFSTSPQLYIVREPSAITRNADPTKRRNWMFVTVTEMEVCQIRKIENRYNLPVNTRFHWVTVVPLDLEHPYATSSTAGAAPNVVSITQPQLNTSLATTSTTTSTARINDAREPLLK